MTRKPRHPGILLKRVMDRRRLTQQEVADALKVSRLSVNQIINDKRSITPKMALALERVLGISAEIWYGMQQRVNLYNAQIKLVDVLPRLTPLKDLNNAATK